MTYRITRYSSTVMIALPPSQWEVIESGCSCDICKRRGGLSYWDTLNVSCTPPKNKQNDFTWRVHHPRLHTDAEHAEADAIHVVADNA